MIILSLLQSSLFGFVYSNVHTIHIQVEKEKSRQEKFLPIVCVFLMKYYRFFYSFDRNLSRKENKGGMLISYLLQSSLFGFVYSNVHTIHIQVEKEKSRQEKFLPIVCVFLMKYYRFFYSFDRNLSRKENKGGMVISYLLQSSLFDFVYSNVHTIDIQVEKEKLKKRFESSLFNSVDSYVHKLDIHVEKEKSRREGSISKIFLTLKMGSHHSTR